jgi:hypothetical protein
MEIIKRRKSIALETRRGRPIPNEQDPDPLPHQAKDLIERHKRLYPLAIMRRNYSGLYNCHGMTFANRRTNILESATVRQILSDDGHRQISAKEIQEEDIIIYFNKIEITHSRIVIQVFRDERSPFPVPPKILSKWGKSAEYIHAANPFPYAEDQIAYWTDRPR